MLLPIPIYRPVASQFLIDVIFASVRVILTQTPESVLRHSCLVITTVDTGEGRICKNKESQIDYPFEEDQKDL